MKRVFDTNCSFNELFRFNKSIVVPIENEQDKPKTNCFHIFHLMMTCLGLASYESRKSKLINRIQKFTLLVNLLLLVYSILLNLFFIYRSGPTSTPIFSICFYSMMTKIVLDTQRVGYKFDDSLIKLVVRIDMKTVKKIKKIQYFCLFIVSASILFNFFQLYIGLNSNNFGYEVMLHGKKNVLGNKLIMFLTSISQNFCWSIVVLKTMYYISVQLLLVNFSENCKKNFILLTQKGDLNSIKYDCNLYNESRETSNETIGFIPFLLITLKWSIFVIGITMAMSSKNGTNSMRNYLYFFPIILINTISILFQIFSSYIADLNMNEARRNAGNILNSSTCYVSQVEVQRLNAYFFQNPIVSATLWHFGEINPNLILSSFGAMFSFSVIFFTTFEHFLG